MTQYSLPFISFLINNINFKEYTSNKQYKFYRLIANKLEGGILCYLKDLQSL